MKRSVSSWVLGAMVGGLCCIASISFSDAAQQHIGRTKLDSNHDVCPLASMLNDVDDEVVEVAAREGGWVVLSHDWLSYGCPPEAAYAAKPQKVEEAAWVPTADAVCMGVLAPTDLPNRDAERQPEAELAKGITPRRPALMTADRDSGWWPFPTQLSNRLSGNLAVVRKYNDSSWLGQWIGVESERRVPIHHAGYKASDYQVYNYPPFFGEMRSDRATTKDSTPGMSHLAASYRNAAELHNPVPERNMLAEMYHFARASLRDVSEKTVLIQAELISLTRSARTQMARNSAAEAKAPKTRPARKRNNALKKAALMAPVRSFSRMVDHYLKQLMDLPLIENPERELLHFERSVEITLCGSTFQGDWRAIREAIEDSKKPPQKPKNKPKKRNPSEIASHDQALISDWVRSIEQQVAKAAMAAMDEKDNNVAESRQAEIIK